MVRGITLGGSFVRPCVNNPTKYGVLALAVDPKHPKTTGDCEFLRPAARPLAPCPMTLEEVKRWTASRPTLADALGIEITAVAADCVEGRMPVDGRTHQPMGLLHGGASVALAETLGSLAAATRLPDRTKQACVGLEINANHIKGVREGWVRGRATPVHIGRSTQVWEIRITHEETEALVCISRITMAVIDLPAANPKQA